MKVEIDKELIDWIISLGWSGFRYPNTLTESGKEWAIKMQVNKILREEKKKQEDFL